MDGCALVRFQGATSPYRNMEKTLVYTTRMPIRWGDMDAMGHVNNTVYFRYLEQARIEWLTKLGFGPDAAGEGPVIINAHCTFLKQLKFPGDIEVRTYVRSIGRSSFETVQDIRRSEDPETVWSEGGAKVVWINYEREKSVPLSDDLRRRLTNPIE